MLFSCTVRAAVVLATGGAALLRGEAGTNVGEKPWLAISTDWDFCFSLQGAQKQNHNREMQIQRYPSINQSICGNGNSYMTFSGSKEEQSKSICMRGGLPVSQNCNHAGQFLQRQGSSARGINNLIAVSLRVNLLASVLTRCRDFVPAKREGTFYYTSLNRINIVERENILPNLINT